ncbi:unnamed protein product [Alternaria alternata]
MDFERESQRSASCCSIQDLSSELILMIMDHLPYATQFDLARTCKRLAIASRGVLELYQDSYAKYRVASDLDPSTVPLLLRSAFGKGSPIPAWHVRSFEIWKDRTAWSEWQKFDLYTPLVSEEDATPSQHRVSKEDARRYLDWLEEQSAEDLEYELIEELLAQVDSGHDGLLKAMLFAKLERLQDLKFVTRSQDQGSCLPSLRLLIGKCIKKRKKISWPVGFRAIQKVAVGVASGTWMDDNRDKQPCTLLFSYLLRLPSLDSIYFDKLYAFEEGTENEENPEEDEWYYQELLPEGKSSVKHIFLNGCSGQLGEEEEYLWAAPRQLLTISIRFDGSDDFDGSTGTANRVTRDQKNSLQSLMWYGYITAGEYPRNIVGDHCAIYDNEEFDHLKTLQDIRHITVCADDIDLCVEHGRMYDHMEDLTRKHRDDEDDEGNIYDEEDDEMFAIQRIATMFPRTIETLVLWAHADESMTSLIERGLIRMVQSGRYKNLKAIFSEPMERASRHSGQKKAWFQDLIAAGKEAGVDVYTLSNQDGMQHSIEFTEAPDEYDLHSGIHGGVRPSGWVFDPYLGRRISPECKAEGYDTLWADFKVVREAYWRNEE